MYTVKLPEKKIILPISFQLYGFYFFLLSYCTMWDLQQNEVVRAESFAFVPVLERKCSIHPMKYVVCYGFLADTLYEIEEVPFSY